MCFTFLPLWDMKRGKSSSESLSQKRESVTEALWETHGFQSVPMTQPTLNHNELLLGYGQFIYKSLAFIR